MPNALKPNSFYDDVIYVKMFPTYTEEDALFINMYKDIADEVAFEQPMNWNSFQNRNLIKPLYKNTSVVNSKKVDK